MKKVFLALILAAVSFHSNAQKQVKGDIPIELEFSPLGASPLKISNLKGRYFFKDNFAFRMGLFLGGTSNPTYTSANDVELVSKTKAFNFSIRPGFEKHFEGTAKLSPYLGTEMSIEINTDKSSSETLWSNNTSIKTLNINNLSSIFGVNIFTGTDFYITEKFFLGVEIGFGFQYEGRGKTSVKWTNPETPATEVDSEETGNTSSFQWGPNYQGTIRLGYCLSNTK